MRSATGQHVALADIAEVSPALQGTASKTMGGDTEVLAITPAAVGNDQRINRDRLETVRPQGKVERYRLRADDLLLVLRLPLKLAMLNVEDLDSPDIAVIAAGTVAIVRVDRNHADPAFVAWCLLQSDVARELARVNSGTNVQFISMQSIRSLEIPSPPLDLQRRIAGVIEVHRRIETLEDAHRAATRTYINAVAHQATASAFTSLPNRDQR